MDNHFIRLTNTSSLEDLIKRSQTEPVIIFKHSTTCPASASAYTELTQLRSPVNLIEVQSAREMSKEIERRFGILHESPQVIVLKDGKVVWDASHWQIKVNAVEAAVKNHS